MACGKVSFDGLEEEQRQGLETRGWGRGGTPTRLPAAAPSLREGGTGQDQEQRQNLELGLDIAFDVAFDVYLPLWGGRSEARPTSP